MISNNTTKLETLLNKINELPSNSTPAGWADVSQVTASAGAVMEGEMFVDKNGNLIEGTMPIYSGDEVTLDTTNTTHVLDGGFYEDYHVNIELEEKTVTPTDTQQIITPSAGKVLSKVTVEAASGGGGGSVEVCEVQITIDETAGILGTQVIDGEIAPIYFEFSSGTNWFAPRGSVVVIAYGLPLGYDANGATYLGTNSQYAPAGMNYVNTGSHHVFRIDAQAGETVTIDIFEQF